MAQISSQENCLSAAWPSALFLILLLAAPGFGPATEANEPSVGILKAIDIASEGRLLRITLHAAAPFARYSLARKGPPEKRDLLIRLPGFVSGITTAVDTGEYLLPVEISPDDEEGRPGLKVLLGHIGDSLVSVSMEADELRIVIIPPQKRSEAADSYRIGANDVLTVDVFGHEDLGKTLKVSPRGSINFPLIGTVSAEGQTVDDLAAEIKERLAKDYIQDPQVTVSVWEYLSQWVNVVGDVVRPGRYYMTGATTLIDALSQAGGLKETAGSEILVTRRPDQVDPASAGEVFRIDLKALFGSEGTALNLRLRSGDIVNVRGGGSSAPSQAVRP